MKLTEDNFLIYAANNYENHFCLSEEEFRKDLEYLKTVRRMMSKLINNEDINIKLLINNIIIFYNVFNHNAASEMLGLKITKSQVEYFNAFLTYLSLPTIYPHNEINVNMYIRIKKELV